MNFILALCLLFQRDRKPLQSRKDEYWRGANLSFVSTGTQD
ncbi:hypothetical protein [Bacillus altitudinis]|nr:hypothetical protein [Bacillus altitudinis]